jgi:hypothetical protein
MIQKLNPIRFGNALSTQAKAAQDALLGTTHLSNTAQADNLSKLSLVPQDQWSPSPIEKHSNLNASTVKPIEEIEASKVKHLNIPYSIQMISHSSKSESTHNVHPDKVEFVSPGDAYKKMYAAKSIAIGDLHASTEKLFETLVVGGFVHMPEKKLKQLQHALAMQEKTADIIDQKVNYGSSPVRLSPDPLILEKNALKRYHKQVVELLPYMKWAGGDKKLILIGDVLSDRGPYDPTTLAIINHLDHQAPGKIIKIASNHDHNALNYVVSNQLDYPFQSQSLRNALRVARQQYGGEDKLKASYINYLSQSQLLHWDNDSKTLYMHAPITQRVLEQSINKLNNTGLKITPYKEVSSENLPQFIQSLNDAYRIHILEMTGSHNSHPTHKHLLALRNEAFEKLVWCRSPLNKASQIAFNQKQHGVELIAHGHDSKSFESPFSLQNPSRSGSAPVKLVNLDNEVRKQGYIDGSSPMLMIEN